MRGKRIFFTVFVLCVLIVHSTSAATHYVSGISSVDGTIIAWGGTTAYATQCAFAMSTWNALGKISITPDTVWVIEDLKFKDIDSSSFLYRWAASWQQNIGADYLYLNKYYMKSETSTGKQSICTHELGHALGLAHSIIANVMYASPTITTLGSQDKSDYSYLYP